MSVATRFSLLPSVNVMRHLVKVVRRVALGSVGHKPRRRQTLLGLRMASL